MNSIQRLGFVLVAILAAAPALASDFLGIRINGGSETALLGFAKLEEVNARLARQGLKAAVVLGDKALVNVVFNEYAETALMYANAADTAYVPYFELVVSIPSVPADGSSFDRPAFYFPYVVTSSSTEAALGRAVWGTPYTIGKVTYDLSADDPSGTFAVSLNRNKVLEMSMSKSSSKPITRSQISYPVYGFAAVEVSGDTKYRIDVAGPGVTRDFDASVDRFSPAPRSTVGKYLAGIGFEPYQWQVITDLRGTISSPGH